MTAADIPSALRWDISHAKRTLRDQPLALLQDALRLESQRSRPRKRLQKWLMLHIDLAALEIKRLSLLEKYQAAVEVFDTNRSTRILKQHSRVLSKIIRIKDDHWNLL